MLLKLFHSKDLGNISTIISFSGSDHSSSEGTQLLAHMNRKYGSFYHNSVLSFFLSITCDRRLKCTVQIHNERLVLFCSMPLCCRHTCSSETTNMIILPCKVAKA